MVCIRKVIFIHIKDYNKVPAGAKWCLDSNVSEGQTIPWKQGLVAPSIARSFVYTIHTVIINHCATIASIPHYLHHSQTITIATIIGWNVF